MQATFLRKRDLSYIQDRGHVNLVKKVKSKKTPRVKHGILFVGRLKVIKHAIGFSPLFIYCLLFYSTLLLFYSSTLLLWLLTSDLFVLPVLYIGPLFRIHWRLLLLDHSKNQNFDINSKFQSVIIDFGTLY